MRRTCLGRGLANLHDPRQRWLLPGLLLAGVLGCSAVEDSLSPSMSCGASGAAPNIGEWDDAAVQFEQQVLALTNQRRSAGGCCGSRGCFAASAALVENENLQAAARLHARDMGENDYFSHESRDGRTVLDRTQAAGFGGCAVGENIAQGYRDPQTVVDGWRESDGHCANLLSPRYRRLGVGFYDAPGAKLGRVWVQNFGD